MTAIFVTTPAIIIALLVVYNLILTAIAFDRIRSLETKS
jgi:hypothetical protein